MSTIRKLNLSKNRRKARVRFRLKNDGALPRVSVFRSIKQIYAQVIDDAAGKTVVGLSSLDLGKKVSGDKKAIAHAVGLELAKRALENGIKQAMFDRGSYLYHGRVKSLVDGLREGGLKI